MEGFTQDCRGEEQNDGIEMKEKGKAEHHESTCGGGGGVIMKTSA